MFTHNIGAGGISTAKYLLCMLRKHSQVILTSDQGTTDHLVAFLLPQYILMFGVMTVLMAFTLNLLFG